MRSKAHESSRGLTVTLFGCPLIPSPTECDSLGARWRNLLSLRSWPVIFVFVVTPRSPRLSWLRPSSNSRLPFTTGYECASPKLGGIGTVGISPYGLQIREHPTVIELDISSGSDRVFEARHDIIPERRCRIHVHGSPCRSIIVSGAMRQVLDPGDVAAEDVFCIELVAIIAPIALSVTCVIVRRSDLDVDRSVLKE
jgi:hypothetical protein